MLSLPLRETLQDWHYHMLKDDVRNKAYARAITSAVNRLDSPTTFDLGTGCGILAMIARGAGAHSVVGAECVQHIAKTARDVLAKNRVDRVDVLRCNVAELAGMNHFSLVIAELMDFGGLGENIIRMAQHAQQHLMPPSGERQMIPARLRLMASAGCYSVGDVGGDQLVV